MTYTVHPGAVDYQKLDSGIQVLVVRHQSRRPGYGMSRR